MPMHFDLGVPQDTPSIDEVSEARAQERARAAKQAAQFQEQRRQDAAVVGAAQAYAAELETDVISNALAATEGEMEIAQQAYADAWHRGDGLGVAEASDLMNDARNRINTLRAGLDELQPPEPTPAPQRVSEGVVRHPNEQRAQQGQPTAPPRNVDEAISLMPGLLNSERQWLRDHPDAVTDPLNLQRLDVAFQDAQARGIKRGSEEYFQHFEDRLGYRPVSRRQAQPAGGNTKTIPLPAGKRAAVMACGLDRYC
jgi:hypothetical protein